MSIWVLEAPAGFGDARPHAHHAIQITISLAGALELSCGETALRAPAIAVAADVRHRFAAHGLMIFLFVEPESRAGRAIAARYLAHGPLAELDARMLAPAADPLRATFAPGLDRVALAEAGEALLALLAPPGPAPLPDPRVARIVATAAAHLDRPLAFSAASAGVHLSPSRLRHLFVEQTGLPYKTFMLWLRLNRALDVYAEGHSLTEAAHAAGFSDSAHFSRVFKRHFGLPATTLTRL
jgi:AraC-like DNA-binding protein